MKPRLKIAPLTEEDRVIWHRVLFVIGDQWCGADFMNSYAMAHVHDRRDAELMLDLSNRQAYERAIREEFGAHMPGPAAVGLINLQLALR